VVATVSATMVVMAHLEADHLVHLAAKHLRSSGEHEGIRPGPQRLMSSQDGSP